MNKRNVEKLIPLAINEIEKEFKLDNEESIEIPSEFKGYISNFGAGIIQSGLLSTVCFFENTESRANQDRKKITKIIFNLIKEDDSKNLFEYIVNNQNKKKVIKEKVVDAAIALKLALRVFHFSEEENSGE